MVYAILLCAVASLSTGLGGVIVALCPRMTKRTLCISQGFAAGVMLGISFLDMLPKSFQSFAQTGGVFIAAAKMSVLFGAGWLAAVLMAKVVVPKQEPQTQKDFAAAKRLCAVTTAVIVLHNLPEGMLTSFSGYGDLNFGFHIAFAVALHNIPEGMAVASSALYISSSKTKAVLQSFGAGMAELAGGAAALLLMHSFITPSLLCGVLAVISGLMVQISAAELMPNGAKIYSFKAVFAGMWAGVAAITIGMLII